MQMPILQNPWIHFWSCESWDVDQNWPLCPNTVQSQQSWHEAYQVDGLMPVCPLSLLARLFDMPCGTTARQSHLPLAPLARVSVVVANEIL